MAKSVNELNPDLFGAGERERAVDPQAARRKAMDYLARREYGRDELIGRLRGAGFEADVASEVVATLADEGLQDDRRFTENFIQARIGRGGGPLRIRQALRERGVSDAVVDAILDAVEVDWFEQAREVRRKKFGKERPADFAAKAKQMRFLQYRGFDMEQIRYAVGDAE